MSETLDKLFLLCEPSSISKIEVGRDDPQDTLYFRFLILGKFYLKWKVDSERKMVESEK